MTTIRKRRELLEGKLLPFCKAKGIGLLSQLDVPTLRTFRTGWKYSALSAVKGLEYLRGFLRFCHDSGWIDSNPGSVIKPPKRVVGVICRDVRRSAGPLRGSCVTRVGPLANGPSGAMT